MLGTAYLGFNRACTRALTSLARRTRALPIKLRLPPRLTLLLLFSMLSSARRSTSGLEVDTEVCVWVVPECARDVWLGVEGWSWTECTDIASTRLLADLLAALSYATAVQSASIAAQTRQKIREQVSDRQPPALGTVQHYRRIICLRNRGNFPWSSRNQTDSLLDHPARHEANHPRYRQRPRSKARHRILKSRVLHAGTVASTAFQSSFQLAGSHSIGPLHMVRKRVEAYIPCSHELGISVDDEIGVLEIQISFEFSFM